ncbi:hypothetical protein M011DRAFT_479818 [Sporormia fimetaria CBS 119925]|uniref:Uncharacterized protein n=1 Tax=Sporormia fimetaria CBS 119925 TaxID=1340428 RepID=A0A6A6V3T8_9PLEO|nr:hypothetical protein M011DRAFT_479818 [Sporormia fimetaria CBS 119925]
MAPKNKYIGPKERFFGKNFNFLAIGRALNAPDYRFSYLIDGLADYCMIKGNVHPDKPDHELMRLAFDEYKTENLARMFKIPNDTVRGWVYGFWKHLTELPSYTDGPSLSVQSSSASQPEPETETRPLSNAGGVRAGSGSRVPFMTVPPQTSSASQPEPESETIKEPTPPREAKLRIIDQLLQQVRHVVKTDFTPRDDVPPSQPAAATHGSTSAPPPQPAATLFAWPDGVAPHVKVLNNMINHVIASSSTQYHAASTYRAIAQQELAIMQEGLTLLWRKVSGEDGVNTGGTRAAGCPPGYAATTGLHTAGQPPMRSATTVWKQGVATTTAEQQRARHHVDAQMRLLATMSAAAQQTRTWTAVNAGVNAGGTSVIPSVEQETPSTTSGKGTKAKSKRGDDDEDPKKAKMPKEGQNMSFLPGAYFDES